MHTYAAHFWVGVWLLILPFLGIPGGYKDGFTVFTALGILAYAFLVKQSHRRKTRSVKVEEVDVLKEETSAAR
ncbi:MAG: hypothetical protein Q7R93_03625 [bacterium]|nr:hypothetical protein [bacterium]